MLCLVTLKIGVTGSANGELMEESRSSAFVLGQALGQADCCLVKGGDHEADSV